MNTGNSIAEITLFARNICKIAVTNFNFFYSWELAIKLSLCYDIKLFHYNIEFQEKFFSGIFSFTTNMLIEKTNFIDYILEIIFIWKAGRIYSRFFVQLDNEIGT